MKSTILRDKLRDATFEWLIDSGFWPDAMGLSGQEWTEMLKNMIYERGVIDDHDTTKGARRAMIGALRDYYLILRKLEGNPVARPSFGINIK